MQDFKTTAMVFGAFAAGMMYAIACTDGKAGGIDSANAATEATCTTWQYYEDTALADCESAETACTTPAGWEPFAALAYGTSPRVVLRRCMD